MKSSTSPHIPLLQFDGEQLEVHNRKLPQFDLTYSFVNKRLDDEELPATETFSNYIISQSLAQAVNAAMITGRPLLLKGEPGCGKTRLAKAVAVHLHGPDTNKYYFEWFVKSRSLAKEGCYTYDQIQRLRDATISEQDEDARERSQSPDNYIQLGPLGRAIASIPPDDKPAVLLIDEIDKGDIDFPNDLLLELDELRFAITEKNNFYINATHQRKPLVIITSNNERDLPAAFLRRCLYYSIPRLDKAMLETIVNGKLKEFYREFDIVETKKLTDDQISTVIEGFLTERDGSFSSKQPSTSEMLDWLKILMYKVAVDGEDFHAIVQNQALRNLALKLL